MELRLLHTFTAVAELRHFARAADRCNLSQPAVSHQIRQLEEELGTKLLNRDGRRVSLTVAGELLLEDARRIVAAVDRARERVQNVASGRVGRVRLGATETVGLYLLPAVLDKYRREHPEFALQFTIGPELEILERVAANDLDMAVVSGRPVLGELKSRRVAGDELVLIASSRSPLSQRRRLTPRDLEGETWIMREDGCDTRRHTDAWLRRNHLAPAKMLTLQGPDSVKRAVIAGLGIGVVARSVAADEAPSRRIVALRVSSPIGEREVIVVDHPHKHHGAACTAMLNMLTRSWVDQALERTARAPSQRLRNGSRVASGPVAGPRC